MRRVFLILTIILSNVTLFSCTSSELAEEVGIEELGTTGEDGDILPPEEDEGGV